MNAKDILMIAQSDAVFAVLFIGILWIAGRFVKQYFADQKQESLEREAYIMDMHKQQMEGLKDDMIIQRDNYNNLLVEQRLSFDKRENELLKVLNKNTDQLTGVAETMKDIQRGIVKLEDRMEDNFMQVWKELGSKADKADLKQ